MTFFLTTTIGRSILAGVGIALLLGGAYLWARHEGVMSERNAATARALNKIETDRKDREKNDEKARSLDDDAALRCLRNPAGCR